MSFFNEMLEWAPAVGMTAGGLASGQPWLVGAGLGSAKGKLETNKARGDRKRAIEVESIKERYSPWTKQHGDANAVPNAPSVFSQMLGEGATGAMLGGMANDKGWFNGPGSVDNSGEAASLFERPSVQYDAPMKSRYGNMYRMA